MPETANAFPPEPGPARKPVQCSDAVHAELTRLARKWRAEEQLPRPLTYDDVIRRLLQSRKQLAEILAERGAQ